METKKTLKEILCQKFMILQLLGADQLVCLLLFMSKTVVRKNESLDDALRRFKRAVTKAGTLQETRKREFYEKPSVKRKRKSEAARKRKKF